jgi:hypothetical protein
MIRRIAALLLIATSAWLLYQATESFIGPHGRISADLHLVISNPRVWAPMAGGLLGLLGGLMAFFGGGGGGAVALIGALIAAMFSLTIAGGRPAKIWEDEGVVGLTMLVLALAAMFAKRE